MDKDYKSLFDLTGKVALITGAVGSIGKQYARALAQNGVHLALVDLRYEALTGLKNELITDTGVKVETFCCDLRKHDQIVETVSNAMEKLGQIDILLNHAGLNDRKPALNYMEDDWYKIVDVNAKGAFFMAQQVGKHMVKNKTGKIVNTASVSSFRGHPTLSIYAMTKGAIRQMTQVLANEWAKHNVNVNAIAPGYIYTQQTGRFLSDENVHNSILNKIPQGRIGYPGDLVGTMLFLCSAASDYLTGQTIVVDGGRTVD